MMPETQPRPNPWGDWLREYEWTHVVHLTTRTPWSPRRLLDALGAYDRALARSAQGPVPCFYAIEQRGDGYAHAHLLLGGTAGLRTARLESAWRYGFSRVQRYDAARGGAHYITKALPRAANVLEPPARCEEYGFLSKRKPPRIGAAPPRHSPRRRRPTRTKPRP